MFKKLLLSAIFLISSTANAEVLMKKPVVCDFIDELMETIEDYQEIPLFSGNNASLATTDDKRSFFNTRVTVFMSLDNNSYSIIEYIDDKVACVLGMGNDIDFGVQKSEGFSH